MSSKSRSPMSPPDEPLGVCAVVYNDLERKQNNEYQK